MAAKLSGHVRTRLIDGDMVPHGDKIFSVHEPHTRWISKGKAGRPVELGVPVSIAVDRLGYKLDWEIQWTGGDRESIIPLAERIRAQFGRIGVFSLDKGHWSPGILAALDDIAEMPVMNKNDRVQSPSAAAELFQNAESGGFLLALSKGKPLIL